MEIYTNTLVIGGGPQGCCVAAHLVHRGTKDFRILDTSPLVGNWGRLDDFLIFEDLRTPHSAGIDPDGTSIRSSAYDYIREHIFGKFVGADKRRFKEHLKGVIQKYNLQEHHVSGRAVQVSHERMRDGIHYRVTTDDGKIIHCRNIAVAVGLGRPRMLQGESHSRVIHSINASHIKGLDVSGKRIAIAGGGITGQTLACLMTERGAHVTMYSRGTVTVSQTEVSPNWFPGRLLFNGFRKMGTDEKLAALQAARSNSTVTPYVAKRFAASGVSLVSGTSVKSYSCSDNQITVISDSGGQYTHDYLILATGFVGSVVNCCPFLSDYFKDKAIKTIGGRHNDMFPVLNDDLSACSGIYFAGRYASMGCGPLAGNMPGAQFNGRTIAQAIAPLSDTQRQLAGERSMRYL